MSHGARRSQSLWVLATLAPLATLAACGASTGAAPASTPRTQVVTTAGALPAGTPLTLTLEAPPDGALLASPPGEVELQGSASVGAGTAAPATLVLVLDVSQASQAPAAGVCDPGSTGIDTVLGCELAAAAQIVAAAPASLAQVGVVVFGGGGDAEGPPAAAAADMGGAADAQPFAAPGPDVATVLQSVSLGEVAQFTDEQVSAVAPSLAAALAAAGALAGAGPGKAVVFLAEGTNAAGPAVADAAFPADVVVRAFALGDHACADDAGGLGGLAAVAARGAAGSTCARLAALADLPDVAAAGTAELQALAATVDGGAPLDLTASATPALPQAGPAEVTFEHTLAGLAPGVHALCVQASGEDGGGAGAVEACVQLTVASISLAPATDVSELGTPGETHTVVATVAAGAAGGVAGVPIAFAVVSGPDAGRVGAGTTDAAGQASFTYAPRAHCDGLGTDTIQACFTDAQDAVACATATQTWQDTTPPVPSCPPGPNPAGHVTGSTANGFYRLLGLDAVDDQPEVFLEDAGTGTVFGPFASGVAVKYTQAPGRAPGQQPMAGQVSWHLFGQGDALVYARDCAGNVSEPILCPVPPGK